MLYYSGIFIPPGELSVIKRYYSTTWLQTTNLYYSSILLTQFTTRAFYSTMITRAGCALPPLPTQRASLAIRPFLGDEAILLSSLLLFY